MSIPRYAALAARLLGRREPHYAPLAVDRERSIETIERALAARQKRVLRRRALGISAALAACAVAWWGVRGALSSSTTEPRVAVVASPLLDGARVLDSTGEVPLDPELKLRVGGRIGTAAGGGAHLELSTGTRLELESASSLTLESQGALQRFALGAGALRARVAKLGPAERFVIDTPDAQIEVRGTVFRLSVLPRAQACGEGSRTRLDVAEGVVEVRAGSHLDRIAAGQVWPSDCGQDTDPSAVRAPPPEPSAAEPRAAAGVASGSKSPVKRPHSLPRSPLAAQSDLFEQAVRAQRRGDAAGALRLYADLLERYPLSPLAENARVERMRVFAQSDRALAKREALGYLARYPNGFARMEAQHLVETE
jgi:ferric-dicitrate binding protein FerR (iron transport regulator)